MRRTLRRTLLGTLFCLAFIAWPTIASADGSSLDSVLKGLDWGMSHEDVLSATKKQMMAEYKKEAKEVYDTAERDRLRKSTTERFDLVQKSYRELSNNDKSGLEVSIVYDEYAKGNNEAALLVRDKIATRYLFFVNDQLYKISVAYNPDYVGDIEFMPFLGSVSKKYGAQKETFEDDLAQIVEAVWEKGGTRLRVKDRSMGYEAYLMTFTDKGLESKVEDLHKKIQDEYLSEPTVGDEIAGLKNENINDDELGGYDAAADLLGEETDFNLEGHLSPEEQAALKGKIGDGNKSGAKGGGTSGEVKKVKNKKRRRKSKKKQKLDGIEATKGGGDVIIY